MSDDPTKSYTGGRPVRVAGADDASGSEDSLTLTWRTPRGDHGVGRTIPRTLGPVRLIEEIGRGGMGVVYRGWDEVLRRPVAVKLLLGAVPREDDPHFEQFLAGARAEAALRHPNIVAVHTAGTIEGLPYLVMDLIEGPTLGDVLRRSGSMSPGAAAKVMSDVAEAVALLHEHGYVHRDLKPGNVLFDQDARVYVTDFGLASLSRGSGGPLFLAGTPAYMAPEAFRGKATPQSDVYALGIMYYELLAGQQPFRADLEEIAAQHAHAPLDVAVIADCVPAAVVEVLERATHQSPMFRYKTAQHFQRAVHDSLPGGDPLSRGQTELKALVARSVGQPPVKPGPPPSEKKPGSSYFDRIAEFAAKKRRALDQPAQTEAPVPPERVEAPAERRVAHDVPCVECAYNLRSLSPTACCPECNTAVSSSLDSERLIFADPRWLSKVARGSTLFYAATFPLLWPLLLGLPAAVRSLLKPTYGADSVATMLVFVSVSTLILGAMTAGVFLTTAAERHRAIAGWGKTARVSAVLLCCGAFASVGLVGVGYVVTLVYMVIWCGLAVLTVAALVRHFSEHARRIPDLRLARRLQIVAVVIAAMWVLWGGAVLVLGPYVLRFPFFLRLVPLLVTIVLVWAQVSSHRRAVKRAIAEAIPYHDLFGRPARGGADDSDMGGPVGMPDPQVRDLDAAIVRDVPCAACEYNLRGLTALGNCPECNEPVSSSLRPDRLMFADTRWLLRVRLGQTVIYGGLVGWILFALVLPLAALGGLSESLVLWASRLIALAVVVLLLVGIFLSTSGEPRARQTKSILARPWVARGAALVAIAAAVGARWLGGAARSTDVLTDWHPALVALGTALRFLAAAALLLAAMSLLRNLMTLADRVPDRKLVRRTWEAAILLCGVTILLAAWPVTKLPVLQGVIEWIVIALILLGLATALFIWALMGAFRRAIKKTVAMAVLHGELFCTAGTTSGVAVEPTEPDRRPDSEAEKRTVPGKNPGDILKLQRCPQCDYSLGGLPRCHRCPECGFEYDESMFVLHGWGWSQDRPGWWNLLPGAILLLGGIGWLSQGPAYVEREGWVWPVFFLTCGAWLIVSWILRRRAQRLHGGTIQYTFCSTGVAQQRGVGPPHFFAWQDFRRLRFRRRGPGRWRFRLGFHLRRLKLHPRAQRLVEIAGTIECSRREAALIRSEIRRRLRASQEQ